MPRRGGGGGGGGDEKMKSGRDMRLVRLMQGWMRFENAAIVFGTPKVKTAVALSSNAEHRREEEVPVCGRCPKAATQTRQQTFF